jgi:hypothetical protein
MLPLYPWTPTTFKELNTTNNFYMCTSYFEEINPYLIRLGALDGVDIHLWKDRLDVTWSHTTPGTYLKDDATDKEHRYAMFTYESKKLLYVYGRTELKYTAQYLSRIETRTDYYMREQRYISTINRNLQHILENVRHFFESGGWIRWQIFGTKLLQICCPNVGAKIWSDSN